MLPSCPSLQVVAPPFLSYRFPDSPRNLVSSTQPARTQANMLTNMSIKPLGAAGARGSSCSAPRLSAPRSGRGAVCRAALPERPIFKLDQARNPELTLEDIRGAWGRAASSDQRRR